MRSRIEEGPDGLCSVIPSHRRAGSYLFQAAWLAGWTWFGFQFVRGFFTGSPGDLPVILFSAVCALGWVSGVVFGTRSLLWGLTGIERVTVRSGGLVLRREYLGWGRSREYDTALIRNLRASRELVDGGGGSPYSGPQEVAFDYGARTVRFGEVDDAESRMIVETLARRLRLPQATRG